jgi:methylase of polypeptide subunit release factors
VASEQHHGQYDLVVSNPPYIPSGELADLEPEVVKYEDIGALDGGNDGLDIVRDIVRYSPVLLDRAGGVGCGELWMEVAHQHPQVVAEWFRTQEAGTGTEAGAGTGTEIESRAGAESGTKTQTPVETKSEPFNEHFSFVEGIIDLAGNPRFVRLRLK